ncbi:hypothetical protein MNBD_ALPHA02-1280 [hydrothermal vent metagenome]|uniref:DUF4169 domain-containing protein n=1 Tax=hydrothermal vent metagenome TaxID=652676 RepID=A0A3B0RC61_9ZZZZ
MGNIIKFSRARKTLAKQKKDAQASKNRAKFGQKKVTKSRTRKEKDTFVTHLNNHRLEEPED